MKLLIFIALGGAGGALARHWLSTLVHSGVGSHFPFGTLSVNVLGSLGIPVEMGSSVVAAMAFGIVLDDSTHLLIRIQQLVRSGYDPSTAVNRGIRELLPPIITTTGLITAGFMVLYLAEARLFTDFATVIGVTMVSALATDVWILPLLVRKFMPDPVAQAPH